MNQQCRSMRWARTLFSLGSSAAWSESPLSAVKIAELGWFVQHGLWAVSAGRSGCSLHAHFLMYTSQRLGSNDHSIKFATSAPLRLSFFLSFFLFSFSFFFFFFLHSIFTFIDLCRLLLLFHRFYMSYLYSIPRTSMYMWHERNKVMFSSVQYQARLAISLYLSSCGEILCMTLWTRHLCIWAKLYDFCANYFFDLRQLLIWQLHHTGTGNKQVATKSG